MNIEADCWYDVTVCGRKISGRFHADSSRNININGSDYVPGMVEFCLNTEVGYRNNFYNQNLYPKLRRREQNDDPLAISKYFAGCTYHRKIRLNRMSQFIRPIMAIRCLII